MFPDEIYDEEDECNKSKLLDENFNFNLPDNSKSIKRCNLSDLLRVFPYVITSLERDIKNLKKESRE